MNVRPHTKARLLLLLTVLVWGGSFAVVKSALPDASPLVFNTVRMLLATAVLLAVNRRQLASSTREQWTGGALAGLFLAVGYQFQTLGLARTTAAKSALITGLVVVLVPLLAMVPWLASGVRQGSRWPAFMGAALAFTGLAMLTLPEGVPAGELLRSIGAGDLLTACCTLGFSMHLLTLARVSPRMPAGLLATIQIGTAAVLMTMTVGVQPMHLHLTSRLVAALVFTSVFSTAAAFTVQSYAQQHLLATETSVLLTLEPVFAAVIAAYWLGERLSGRGLAGAALILGSIAVVELAPGLMRTRELPS